MIPNALSNVNKLNHIMMYFCKCISEKVSAVAYSISIQRWAEIDPALVLTLNPLDLVCHNKLLQWGLIYCCMDRA